MNNVPIITIDGTTGSGKGTVGILLAKRLNWHFLDSGAVYRALALIASEQNIAADDEKALGNLANNFKIKCKNTDNFRVFYMERDITEAIRTEECGIFASKIAVLLAVRNGLLACQRGFEQLPGLVADGRDMGTVVFPEAKLKIFLDAKPEERALRRQKQLQQCGISANFHEILRDLVARDERDAKRALAPLKPAADSLIIDSTNLGIDEVVLSILEQVKLRNMIAQGATF